MIRSKHENATDDQIAAPIKIWLAHAKERLERKRSLREREEGLCQNLIVVQGAVESVNDQV